jgi:hypothetical protein
MRRVCILAVASLAVAGSAQAATVPVPLSFNHAIITTPGFKYVTLVKPSTKPITATAQFDQTNVTFTIAPAEFHFPTFSFTTPVPGTLQVSLNGPATGQFNPTTGAITMTADFVSTINLTSIGTCTADSGSQTYTTSNKTVYPGLAFPATASGAATGPGALSGGWPNVQMTGSACPLVSSALNGPGGLWISKDVNPPKLKIAAAPTKATKTVGQSITIKVTVKDVGGVAARKVKVCESAPKAVRRVRGTACRKIASLPAGTKKTMTFKVKGTHTGKFKVKFSAGATGVSTVHAATLLRIKK